MAALRYTFASWAERTIGSAQPAMVRLWFLERGLDVRRQTWRQLLQSQPRSCEINTWLQICEAADEPLSAFLQIIPSGHCKPKSGFRRRPRPGTSKVVTKPAAKRLALPQRPSDFFRGLQDG